MNARETHIGDLDLNLFVGIAKYLTLVEINYLLIVNKPIRELLMQDAFWQGRFGVANYIAFTVTLSFLQDPDLIDTFSNGFMSGEKAIETQKLLNRSEDERVMRVFTADQIAATRNNAYLKWLLARTNRAIIALNEGLFTTDELMSSRYYVDILTRDIGLTYFRKKLPLSGTAFLMDKYDIILTPNGLKALEEKLITIDHILKSPNATLKELLSDEGIEALCDGLFPAESFIQYKSMKVEARIKQHSDFEEAQLQTSWQVSRNIGHYIQQMQGVKLDRLLNSVFQCYIFFNHWEIFDKNPVKNPCFYIGVSDKNTNLLQRFQNKLEEQGVQLIIRPNLSNHGRVECSFSERNYQKIKSVLLSMQAADKTPNQQLPHHSSATFFSKKTTESKRNPLIEMPIFSLSPFSGSVKPKLKPVSEFDKLLSALFNIYAGIEKLFYRPLLNKVFFSIGFIPSQEQIDKCSALFSDANISYAFIKYPSLPYAFEIQHETKETFETKITHLHHEKMNSLASENPEPNTHQPKI